MAGIDTSIYGNVKQPDPFAGISTMLNMQGQALNNRLLQLQTLGQAAEGQAFKDAIGPDGSFDMSKFTQSLAKNPAGFAGAAAGVPAAIGAQGGQIANTTAGVNLATTGYQNVGSIWGARLAKSDGPISRDDLSGDIIDGVAQGRVPAALGKAILQQLQATPDADLRSYAAGGWVQSLPPGLVAGAAPGAPAPNGAPTQQTGGQFVTQSVGGTQPPPPTAAAPLAPAATPAVTAPPAVAPPAVAPPVVVPTPRLRPAAVAAPAAVPAAVVPPPAATSPIDAKVQAFTQNLIRAGVDPATAATRAQAYGQQLQQATATSMAPAPAPPAASGAPPAPVATPPATTAAPTPAHGIVTGLSPSASTAMTQTGNDSASAFTTLRSTANNVPDRLGALRNMEADAKNFTSGPLTGDVTKALEAANQAFGTNFNIQGNSAVDNFNKLASQIALAQSAAIGATDLTTTTAMGANPNSGLSNLGIQRIIDMLKGNEDAIAVKQKEAQTWLKTHTPDSYGEFSTNFNQHFDPRVFQSVYWDDATKADALKSMTPDEVKTFRDNFNYAVQQGWINPNAK